MKIFSKPTLFQMRLLYGIVFFLSFLTIFFETNYQSNEYPNVIDNPEKRVLSYSYYGKPELYISGGNYGYSSGGVIPIASTDDPVVEIGGYGVSGKMAIDLYKANKGALLNYITYTNENEQIDNDVKSDNLDFVTSIEKEVDLKDYGNKEKIDLPLDDRGIYYLRAKIGDTTTHSFIVRSNIGGVVKEGNAEYVFWTQDFRSKKSLASGNVTVYNLQDTVTQLANVSINSQGIATSFLTSDADIAIVTQGDELAVIPINLQYLNTGYSWDRFSEKNISKRYFTFTDRPLYRPGDTVYFKSIVRNEDDVRYSIPDEGVKVEITNGWSKEDVIYEEVYIPNGNGAINGQYTLAEDIKTGDYYRLVINGVDYIYFQVQEFRKPEYFLEILTDKREFVSGDNAQIIIRGEHFSGQPLANEKIKYRIESSDFYDYTYYYSVGRQIGDDYRYGTWWYSKELKSGTIELDSSGQAVLDIDTKLEDALKNQVFTVEVSLDNETGQEPAYDRKNLLVYSGDFGIYRKDYSYGSVVEKNLEIPLIVVARKEGIDLAGIEFEINTEISGYERVETNGQVKWNHYTDHLDTFKIISDDSGEAVINIIPQKQGSYHFSVSGTDQRGNKIGQIFYAYVRDKDFSYNYYPDQESGVVITPDKQIYNPGETANLIIYSEIADRDVFLVFERGRVNRYQVFTIEGNTKNLTVPILETDMPNIFVEASTFSNRKLDYANEKLVVSPEKMRLQVKVIPEAIKYGPGETAQIKVETKDINNQPISANVALWGVDKAIFELTESKLGNIFDKFWFERPDNTTSAHSLEGITVQVAEAGGCFAEGSKIQMADGSLKNIEEISPGDFVETRTSPTNGRVVEAKVLDTYKTEVSGYLLINGKLRITDNHQLLVNGLWKKASEIKIGDVLLNAGGSENVSSIEYIRGKFKVYNLHIDKYQTFFAEGIYVHNQKGGPPREVLEDTAYWNPNIQTDTNGQATLYVNLPDNLTTWVFSAVASTSETKVGQNKSEIVVTKDIIVRPILPNFLREGDELVVSSLVQNFTDKDRVFNVELEFDKGEVTNSERTDVAVSKNFTKMVSWKIKPNTVGDAKIKITAYDTTETDLGDVIINTIPVKLYGFTQTEGYAGQGSKEYNIALAEDAVNEETSISVNLSPTILGSLPSAIEYLVDYPYGCIEQTTSRLVPSIIVKRNANLFSELLEEKDIDEIIKKGLARLESLQNDDGGWGWWYGEPSPFLSAYVVEYLMEAKNDGYEVDQAMIDRAKYYFRNLKDSSDEGKVTRYFALTTLNSDAEYTHPEANENMDPVLLAMLVIASKKNGINDNDQNGLNKLIAQAKRQGGLIYWEKGNASRFGSVSASTAMAIRALVASGEERETAVKAVNYLASIKSNYYWQNSFATAQAIRAIVDLAKTGSEQNPNYTYQVEVNSDTIAQGNVTSANQVIRKIKIPGKYFTQKDIKLKISQSGTGQLYSTLVVDQFRTDRNYQASGNLKIKRTYENEKGKNYSIGVGDVVNVNLEVAGWPGGSEYRILEDHLPSGLVPVIETFKNQQFAYETNQWRYSSQGREYRDDRVIFFDRYDSGSIYSYKSRVVAAGEYSVPPATAMLMYSPSVSGVSDAEVMAVEDKSEKLYEIENKLPGSETGISEKRTRPFLLLAVVLVCLSVSIYLRIKNKRAVKVFFEDLRYKLFSMGKRAKDRLKIGKKKHDSDGETENEI